MINPDDVAFVAGLREKLRLVKELGEMRDRAERAEAALRDIGRGFSCATCRNLDAYDAALKRQGIDPAELAEEAKP